MTGPVDQGRALRLSALAAAIALLVLEALVLYRVWNHLGTRFPGVLVDGNLVVSQLNQPYWTGIRAGLRPGDVVVAIDGVRIRSGNTLAEILRDGSGGPVYLYTVWRRGELLRFPVEAIPFRLSDWLLTLAPLAVLTVAFVVMGTAVIWARPDGVGAGTFAFAGSLALAMAGAGPFPAFEPLSSLPKVALPLLAAAILHLALVFPVPVSALAGRAALVAAPYGAVLPLAGLNVFVSNDSPRWLAWTDWTNRWLVFAAAGCLLIRLLPWRGHFRRAELDVAGPLELERPIARERRGAILVGTVLAVVSFGIGFLGSEFGWIPTAPVSAYFLPAWIWLGAIAVAVLRADIFEAGPWARRILLRASAYGLATSLYVMLLGVVVLTVERDRTVPDLRLLAAGLVLLAVVLHAPLRRATQELLAQGGVVPVLSRPRVLREITTELGSSLDPGEIQRRLLSMAPRLGFSRIRLFLSGPNGWAEVKGPGRLPSGHPLVEPLALGRSVALRRREDEPTTDPSMPGSLRQLDLSCAVPLRHGDHVLGFIGFGSDRTHQVSDDELAALSTLAGQVAVALENAHAFERIRELEEQVRAENVVLREELQVQPAPGGLVGTSRAMWDLQEWIRRVGPLDTTVLLRGETGTGKELVARAIHAHSRRRDRPMIRVNCAAVPAQLLESEFFGYERGSFTGATSRKIGRFELAEGGTIFLDEIGDLPLELQPKLLRVLQEREFARIGGGEAIPVDVRVIAATNRDLEEHVRGGRFSEALFFRLNVVPLILPPLRERREDIPALMAHFIEVYGRKMHKRVEAVEEKSLNALMEYDWPGNVRELENVVERAMVLCETETLVVRDVLAGTKSTEPLPEVGALRPLSELLRDVKVRSIRKALAETSGNQAGAASLLGLKPSSLSRMMKDLGLR